MPVPVSARHKPALAGACRRPDKVYRPRESCCRNAVYPKRRGHDFYEQSKRCLCERALCNKGLVRSGANRVVRRWLVAGTGDREASG